MPLIVEMPVFLMVSVVSMYASIKDLQELSYSSKIGLLLLTVGAASFIIQILFYNFSESIIKRSFLNIATALVLSLLWFKLRIIGIGDVEYLTSLALCYPSYPNTLASRLSGVFNYRPMIYAATPTSLVIVTNALFALGFLIMFNKLLQSHTLRTLYLVYIIPLTLTAVFYTPKVLLLLPLPAIIHLIIRSGKVKLEMPFIPCIFFGFLSTLIFGDLLHYFYR